MKLPGTFIIAALAAGSLWGGSIMLQAQNATNRPPERVRPAGLRGLRAGNNVNQLAATLKLDNARKAKVKKILEAEMKKMHALGTDTSLSMVDRRLKVQAVRDETAREMKAVLTPAQFAQWHQMVTPNLRRPRWVLTNNPPVAPQH